MRLYERDMTRAEVRKREEQTDNEGITREKPSDMGKRIKINIQPYKNRSNNYSSTKLNEHGRYRKRGKIGYTKEREIKEGDFIAAEEKFYRVTGKSERKDYMGIIMEEI